MIVENIRKASFFLIDGMRHTRTLIWIVSLAEFWAYSRGSPKNAMISVAESSLEPKSFINLIKSMLLERLLKVMIERAAKLQIVEIIRTEMRIDLETSFNRKTIVQKHHSSGIRYRNRIVVFLFDRNFSFLFSSAGSRVKALIFREIIPTWHI